METHKYILCRALLIYTVFALGACSSDNPPDSSVVDMGSGQTEVAASDSGVNEGRDYPYVDGYIGLMEAAAINESENLSSVMDIVIAQIRQGSSPVSSSNDIAIEESKLYGLSGIDLEPVNRQVFNCDQGGQATIDTGITAQTGSNGGSADHYYNYQFNQCVHEVSLANDLNGTYTLNGGMHFESSAGFGRGTRESTSQQWDDFSVAIGDGINYELNGVVEVTKSSNDTGDSYTRLVNFTRYGKSLNGDYKDLKENIRVDYKFSDGLSTEFKWDIAGTIVNDLTGNASVTIATTAPYMYTTDSSAGTNTLFTGTIEMRFSDGKYVNGVANTNSDNYSIDVEYTTSAGDRLNTSAVALRQLPNLSICMFDRMEASEGSSCDTLTVKLPG